MTNFRILSSLKQSLRHLALSPGASYNKFWFCFCYVLNLSLESLFFLTRFDSFEFSIWLACIPFRFLPSCHFSLVMFTFFFIILPFCLSSPLLWFQHSPLQSLLINWNAKPFSQKCEKSEKKRRENFWKCEKLSIEIKRKTVRDNGVKLERAPRKGRLILPSAFYWCSSIHPIEINFVDGLIFVVSNFENWYCVANSRKFRRNFRLGHFCYFENLKLIFRFWEFSTDINFF